MSLIEFETEIYPRIWHSAYDIGVEARKQGLPRVCNLQGSPFVTPSGHVLKVYLSAWEQGWDRYKILSEFKQVEAVLKNMPLHQCTEADLLQRTIKNKIANIESGRVVVVDDDPENEFFAYLLSGQPMPKERVEQIEEDLHMHGDPAWGRWKRCLGQSTFTLKDVEELTDKLWKEAGMPEDRDTYWSEAEKRLTRRSLGEKGISGACMTDREVAKQTAINQFLRRRKAAAKHGIIDNASLPSGYPMMFYCKWCGILVETLPEDYIFSPRSQCSQCKGLSEMNWLTKAREVADEAGIYMPPMMSYKKDE